MNQKQWLEFIQPNENEKVYIPNEIFQNFKENKQITSKNIAFLYTYYCMISYFFRYCKYGYGQWIDNGAIKIMMGYAYDYDRCNDLIKKGGVLDGMGYTQSIRDFPIQYRLDDYGIEFDMYGEFDQETKMILNMPKNFIVKYPKKAFYRTEGSQDEDILDGTFYDISNTHLFDISLYVDMMESEMGVIGFYIYQYFRHKNNLYKSGYSVGRNQLESEIKMPWRTNVRYIQKLEEKGYIDVERDDPKGKDTAANIYRTRM